MLIRPTAKSIPMRQFHFETSISEESVLAVRGPVHFVLLMAYSFGRWLWKAFLLALFTVVGAFAASQIGWSGAKAIVKVFEGQDALTDVLFGLAMLVLFGVLRYIRRVARRFLWVAVPIWAYYAAIGGVWNGVVSDFDYVRGQAVTYHKANLYSLQHMTEHGQRLTCSDPGIDLAADTEAFCAYLLEQHISKGK
jgi:hypothetical protein